MHRYAFYCTRKCMSFLYKLKSLTGYQENTWVTNYVCDFAALKSDLKAQLDKVVKSMDEDSWMFEGPRSRIHLISRRGLF
ncbi:unnamed protein product [Rhodiola kirilowii]